MKKIVRYKLKNGRIPEWIEDGGYLGHGNGWLVGVTKELDEMPEEAEVLTKKNIKTLIDSFTLYREDFITKDEEKTPLSAAQKTKYLTAILKQLKMSSYE